MKFSEFWRSLPKAGREAFAERVGMSPSSLNVLSYSRREWSPRRALQVEAETGGRVPIEETAPGFARLLRAAGWERAGKPQVDNVPPAVSLCPEKRQAGEEVG